MSVLTCYLTLSIGGSTLECFHHILYHNFLFITAEVNKTGNVVSLTNAADLTIVHLSLIGALKFGSLMAAKFPTRKGKKLLFCSRDVSLWLLYFLSVTLRRVSELDVGFGLLTDQS